MLKLQPFCVSLILLITGLAFAQDDQPLVRLQGEGPKGEKIVYEFRRSKFQVYFRLPDGRAVQGYLDKAGNFIRDERSKPFQPGSPGRFTFNDPSPGVIFGSAIPYYAWESVYEYRSGYLIPGSLNPSGNFVPHPGQIIPLKDYVPGKRSSPRIYNLPGRLVPITKDIDQQPKLDAAK